MNLPWKDIRAAYAEGKTCEELAVAFNVPADIIKKRAKYARWGIDRKAQVLMESLPAVREAGERVAQTADKAAIEFIRSSVDDLNVFRSRWREILAKTETADELDSASAAISRMLESVAGMLGVGRKHEDSGRGIVHIQLASSGATTNASPVIELPAK
jgi:hypothetical protein